MSENPAFDDEMLKSVTPDLLDDLVAYIDASGGPTDPDFARKSELFHYIPGVQVDQDLDPFSDAYFGQMLDLYFELSGRSLDQDTGELTDFNLERHVAAANPLGLEAIDSISQHARAVLTTVMVANPKPGGRILDLGCGWGLSTEMLEFAGGDVTAVDINPKFIELIEQRAQKRGGRVQTSRSNFDDIHFDEPFDFALFYECLHHAVKPWDTIAHLSKFMAHDGRIGFAGEPINAIWWRHWGLRLDLMSMYCIRKFGWFESGWTAEFITAVFARSGWKLSLFPNIGLRNGLVGVAERQDVDAPRPMIVPVVAQPAAAPVAPVAPAPEPSFKDLTKLMRRKIVRRYRKSFARNS